MMGRGEAALWTRWKLLGGDRRVRCWALALLAALDMTGEECAAQALGEVLAREGRVEYGAARRDWIAAQAGQAVGIGDRVRTFAASRATLRLELLGIKRMGELTTLEILPPREPGSKGTIDLKAGALYLFMRGGPREFQIQMPHAVGTSRGTDFHVAVDGQGRGVVTVFDGAVELENPLGRVVIETGEQGLAEAGQPPRKTAVVEALNVVQWWLYYPAVLDPIEIPFTPEERTALADSLEAYESGDLLQALALYPAGEADSDAGRVYQAALLLGAGQVQQAEAAIGGIDRSFPLVSALHEMIAAVQVRAFGREQPPRLASEWLAHSYYLQSEFELEAALEAARRAREVSPSFGFAWARLAELEFSFGRLRRSEEALGGALVLVPRHAQAWALRGFVQAANNRRKAAVQDFERAMGLDGGLGNAWLGRGLCRIARGDAEGGRLDLQVAAALEPNRSLYRAYLGKAFANQLDYLRAEKELGLARRLDPADPTTWLYESLLRQEQGRINEAVASLERSTRLNDNRRVYRSRLLLDQDRAVRAANLANIYQSAGMTNLALAEAARAVNDDYANYSAHLFLARSYNAVRDPTRFNVRYEAAWLNELLVANLLAPVGAGSLSQTVNQQEYSKLFEADRLGFSSDTVWRSDDRVFERASQYGTFGKTSYAIDLDFHSLDGSHPNEHLTRIEAYTRVKQQISAQDELFLLTEYTDFEGGDLFQRYDRDLNPRPYHSFEDRQDPNVMGGYHRTWSPGMHTLALVGHVEANVTVSDRDIGLPVAYKSRRVRPHLFYSPTMDLDYQHEFGMYVGELNQILQKDRHTLVMGTRFQSGDLEASNRVTESTNRAPLRCAAPSFVLVPCFTNPAAIARIEEDLQRTSTYAYYTLEVWDDFKVTGGVAYDDFHYPSHHSHPPIREGSTSEARLSPKAAVVWSPVAACTLRGAYTRSLGGITLEDNFRLEPTQVGGFLQTYRGVMPESVVGGVTAPDIETFGAAIELKLPTRTYLQLRAERIESEVDHELGVFYVVSGLAPAFYGPLKEKLDYQERLMAVSVAQLWADEWAFGVDYSLLKSDLGRNYPQILPRAFDAPGGSQTTDLHRLSARILYHHASGLFGGTDANFFLQENDINVARGQVGPVDQHLPEDRFVQVNVFAGYRFPGFNGDLSVGLLNVTDQSYHLDPLSAVPDLPRERTVFTRFRLNF